MKIKFDKLETSNDSIKVSFNGGKSYEDFNVGNIQKRGIILNDSQNYGKIRIVGKSTILKNLDVVKDISIPNKVFYLTNYYVNYGYDDEYDICADGILVSKLWLKDIFGINDFNGDCLTDPYFNRIEPFGYLEDGEPLLYRLSLDGGPILYTNDTVQKYFYPNTIESQNIAKDLSSLKIYIEDELVFERKLGYAYINDILSSIVSSKRDSFKGYDWDVLKDTLVSSNEETDTYTWGIQTYCTIKDCYINAYGSIWLNNDLTLRICNKREHVYQYNARYVDDQSKFSITFTKSNPKLPDTPTKPFATFLGWYQDSNFRTQLNLGDIDSDTYIYAKWEYHDVTRKFFFVYNEQHFDIELTKKSNEYLYIKDIITNLKNKYTGFSTLSSNNPNYQVTFDTDEELDITSYVNSISVKSFTNNYYFYQKNTATAPKFFTENINYYEQPTDTLNILEKVFESYPKSAFQAYEAHSGSVNGSVINLNELSSLRLNPGNKSIYFSCVDVDSIKVIYDNYDDNSIALEDGLPEFITKNGIKIKETYTGYSGPKIYASLNTITEELNDCVECTYPTYYYDTMYITSFDIKSVDTFNTVHLYFDFSGNKVPTVNIQSDTVNKSIGLLNPDGYTLPNNVLSLASFLDVDISKITKDTNNPEEVPEEGTYSFYFTYNDEIYHPGDLLKLPILSLPPTKTVYLKLKYYAIPINYNTQATLKSKGFFGEDKDVLTPVTLQLNDEYDTDVITDLDIPYSLNNLENCSFSKKSNKLVSLFKSYLNKSINVELLDNQTKNCFGGIGDTNTEENISRVLSQPEIYIYKNLKIEGSVLSNVLALINNGTSINLSTENKSLNESSIGFVLQYDATAYKPILLVSNDVSNDIINDETKTKVVLATNLKNFMKYNNTYYDTEYNVIQVSEDSIIKFRDNVKLNIPTLLRSVSNYFKRPLIGCGSSFITYNLESFSSNNYYNQDFNYEINGFYIGGFNNRAIKVYTSGKLEINTTSTTSTTGLTHLTDINNSSSYRWGAYIGQYNNKWAVWWPAKDLNSSGYYGCGYYITSDTTFSFISGKLNNLGSYFEWTTKQVSPPGATEYFNYNSLGIYVSKGNPVTYKDVPDELKDVNATVGIYEDRPKKSQDPKSVTELVLDGFNGTFDKSLLSTYPNLTKVIIPDGATKINSSGFEGCNKLVEVVIPDSVTSIGDWSFTDCSNIKNISIPSNLTKIEDGTFCDCSSIKKINIPNKVTTIGTQSFFGCESVTELSIPSNVKVIGASAFGKCTSLQTLTIKEGVEQIGNGAFASCPNLTTVSLPSSIKSMGKNIFRKCTSLKTINYNGTRAQWESLELDSSWNEDCPSDMIINYS